VSWASVASAANVAGAASVASGAGDMGWALLALLNLVGLGALFVMTRARNKKLRELVAQMESNERRWQELDALRATMTPCPACGARGGYPTQWRGMTH
jgi:hypothetical protein